MGILSFDGLWLSRPSVFRYKVTPGGGSGKRPPAAWLREKIRQPSAICAKSGIPYFFTCHACLPPPVPRVLFVSKKSPGREKPQGFKQKGEKQKTNISQTSKTLLIMEAAAFQTNAINATAIALSLIQPSGYNPRKEFDEQSLTELADSIRQHGVLQPVGVRPISGTDRYEIVFGERRYRASLIAGRENIPALIYDTLSDNEAEELAITENLQRKDIAPMEEAEAFRSLIESGRYDTRSLAMQVGKSETYIRTRMKLATLIPEIASLLDNEDITVSVASEICRYGEDIQREVYDKHLKDGLPYNSWRGMTASKVAQMIESNFTTELCRYRFDKSACASCPHNTCNLLLFVEEGYEGKCAKSSCLKEKQIAYLTEKAISMLAEHPEANLCQYQYDTNEAVAVRLAEMGYDIENVSDRPNRFPTEPVAPQREEDETEEEYAEAVQEYGIDLQEYKDKCAGLLAKVEAGEISLAIMIGRNDVTLGYKAVPVQQREDGSAAVAKVAELEAKDVRNREIAVERTIADTKEQIKKVDVTEAKFTNEEDKMIYFFLLSSLRREHYEAVGLTDRDPYAPLTDKDKMAIIAKLNAKTKAIIRRDFLIANFKDAYRDNATADLLFAFAKKHMPEEFAAIESQYNAVYEKRHKKLEERIAQLMPKEQPEAEPEVPDTPETAEPEKAVTDNAEEIVTDIPDEATEEITEEAEVIQPDSAEDAPQETNNDTEEAAA